MPQIYQCQDLISRSVPMTFEKQIQQITTVPCIADCAAMAVVKVNKKSKKNSKKGTGKKPRPVALKERPQQQRCPFSISPKLATKFSAMWLGSYMLLPSRFFPCNSGGLVKKKSSNMCLSYGVRASVDGYLFWLASTQIESPIYMCLWSIWHGNVDRKWGSDAHYQFDHQSSKIAPPIIPSQNWIQGIYHFSGIHSAPKQRGPMYPALSIAALSGRTSWCAPVCPSLCFQWWRWQWSKWVTQTWSLFSICSSKACTHQ